MVFAPSQRAILSSPSRARPFTNTPSLSMKSTSAPRDLLSVTFAFGEHIDHLQGLFDFRNFILHGLERAGELAFDQLILVMLLIKTAE